MTERLIIFSGPMVRALLDGRKTQTRRAMKPQPIMSTLNGTAGGLEFWATNEKRIDPPYAIGDHLWVKETWQYANWTEDGEPYIRYRADSKTLLCHHPEEWDERLFDLWGDLSRPENYNIDGSAADRKWRSPRFMPRWASRISLIVEDVRAQRVQDISEEDAIAEGVESREAFFALWDSIHGEGATERNEWVWAYTFRRLM